MNRRSFLARVLAAPVVAAVVALRPPMPKAEPAFGIADAWQKDGDLIRVRFPVRFVDGKAIDGGWPIQNWTTSRLVPLTVTDQVGHV